MKSISSVLSCNCSTDAMQGIQCIDEYVKQCPDLAQATSSQGIPTAEEYAANCGKLTGGGPMPGGDGSGGPPPGMYDRM